MSDIRDRLIKARLEINALKNTAGRALYALDKALEEVDIVPEPTPTPTPTPTPQGDKVWQKFKLGSGGYITAIQITKDDTKVISADVHNAYILDKGDTEWRELITLDSMPEGTIPIGDTYGQHKQAQGLPHKGDGAGVWAAAAAPSNSDIVFVHFYGDMWKSVDRGRTFKATGFPSLFGKANSQVFKTSERIMAPKLAIDPTNPDHVWFASHLGDGTWSSTDGGATAQKLDSTMVPDPVDAEGDIGPHIILFDPTSAVSTGKTQRLYIGVYGKGIYKSEDAGKAWNFIGGPTTFRHLHCDNFGRLWVGDTIKGNRPQWYAPDVGWTACPGTHNVPYYSIAVNPLDKNHIVLYANYSQNVQSFDGGNTWVSWWSKDHWIFDASEGVPWISDCNQRAGMSIAAVAFDNDGSLWGAYGMGVFQCPAPMPRNPYTEKFTIKEMSRGTNLLCVRNIVKVPNGGPLMIACLDRSNVVVTDVEKWVENYGPDKGLHNGHHAAYSPFDPSFIVYAVTKLGKFHGYSDDNAQTLNIFEGIGQLSAQPGGSIAVSEPHNIVHIPGSNGVPKFTLDGGKTWAPLAIPGLPTADGVETGFGFSPWSMSVNIVADTVRPGVFYAYNYGTLNADKSVKTEGGIWRSIDEGRTWKHVEPRGQKWLWASWHPKIMAAPGKEGHVFFVPGVDTGAPAWRCINGLDEEQDWTEITGTYNGEAAKFSDVYDIGFGKGTGDYPAVGILGTLNGDFGMYTSQDNCETWTKIATHPAQSIDQPCRICGDMDVAGNWYASFGGSGGAYLANRLVD